MKRAASAVRQSNIRLVPRPNPRSALTNRIYPLNLANRLVRRSSSGGRLSDADRANQFAAAGAGEASFC